MTSVVLGSGKAALKVSTVGFGCMPLTGAYMEGVVPTDEAVAVLRHAYDLGVRYFDTAQYYKKQLADGTIVRSEEVVGEFLKTLSPTERKDVVVSTKYLGFSNGKLTWDKDLFMKEAMLSRERLGVEAIDLFYFARIFPKDVCPVETWMAAAKDLYESGVIKRVGLSEASAEVIQKANKIMPITCIQQEWSLFARDLEESIVPTCKALGIGIVAYSPVGRGILAGGQVSANDKSSTAVRKNVPFYKAKNLKKNLEIVAQLKAFAERKGCTVSQLCLSWVIHKGAVPIPGTTNLKHIEENAHSADVTLTEEDIKFMEDVAGGVAGERGDEQQMKMSYHAL